MTKLIFMELEFFNGLGDIFSVCIQLVFNRFGKFFKMLFSLIFVYSNVNVHGKSINLAFP